MKRAALLVLGLGATFFVFGCQSVAPNDPNENIENTSDGNDDGGPRDSPRPDGAELLFSAYTPSEPNSSAQNAAFSPDGTRVVFTLFLSGYNLGPAELWIMNVDGSNAHRITPAEDQDNVNVPGAAWNGVTGEIVFASDRGDSDDIWAMHPDGSGIRRVTTHTPPPFWIEPVWSPDGEWIAFEADTESQTELAQRGTIYKVRFDGTELTQLTKRDAEGFDDRLPNWSPGGDRILFQRRIPHDEDTDGDNWDIYAMDTDGDNPFNVSNARHLFNTDNSWSPDGRWIASSSAFQVGGEPLPRSNIIAFFVPDPDLDEEVPAPVRITFSDTREDGAPSVSPAGDLVSFESHRGDDEKSPSDIWIIRTPDPLLANKG